MHKKHVSDFQNNSFLLKCFFLLKSVSQFDSKPKINAINKKVSPASSSQQQQKNDENSKKVNNGLTNLLSATIKKDVLAKQNEYRLSRKNSEKNEDHNKVNNFFANLIYSNNLNNSKKQPLSN